MRLGFLAVLLLSSLSFGADEWANFHPELVKAYSCKVSQENLHAYGDKGPGQDLWEAEAHADRGQDQWAKTVGRFEYTLKGRHQAEKACSKWMDEATKRLKEAHK